jgi:hypothetical protein
MTPREALDKLLASKPGVEIACIDGQQASEDIEQLDGSIILGVSAGPWVCVDFADGQKFAIWKTTGNVYRVDEHGAVEDDPIDLTPPPMTIAAWNDLVIIAKGGRVGEVIPRSAAGDLAVLEVDGSEYDPEEYPELKALLRNRFGINLLPDLRGRVVKTSNE